MRKNRIIGLLAVAALAVTLAIPAAGGASHRAGAPLEIKITEIKPFLHGVLNSTRERCERNRLVVVKRIRPGHNGFVGADISSFHGGWSVDVNRTGHFSVRVDADHGCDGARATIRLTA
jgi:hypothetical protein